MINLRPPAPVRNSPEKVSPVPQAEWATWAKLIATQKSPEDKGVWDTIARIIGEKGSTMFQQWYLNTFGKKCGCAYRKDLWNSMYAY